MEDTTVLFNREDAPRQVVLEDAMAVGVLPTWTEAVALTRAVAWQLYRSGGSAPVPELGDIAIFSTGAVHTEGGSHHADGQVAGVGEIMGRLLEHVSAPAQVVDVRGQAMANPPVFATLMEFHNALDFFARPDAKAVLADFHARAHAALEDSSKNQALEDLKEKSKTAPPPAKKRKPRKKLPKWVAVAAVFLFAVVAAAAAYYYAGGSSNPAVSQTANVAMTTITETGKKLQDATNEIVSKLVGGAPLDPTAAASNNGSPGNATPAIPRRRPTEKPSAAAPQVAAATPPEIPAPSAPPEAPPVAAPAPAPAADPAPFVDAGVYSARDTSVLAPVLIYPQLPTKPTDTALTKPGALDVLVLEDGTVGEARLFPQSDRLQDRMMVSAAKAWRFRPAMKDGRSVRYRVRIPITW